jgi:transcriptional regulator with XRE-family HTH domain
MGPLGSCTRDPAYRNGRKRPPVPEVRSPTLRRRELGALLRSLRLEQGLTVEQVAEHLLCSPSKVSRLETGHRGATPRDVRDLCALYGVTDPAQRERMAKLAQEGKQQGWWQPYELQFATYVGLEAAAVSLAYFQNIIVPGLLQTADYARAMHQADVGEYTPERIEEHVEVRMRRQALLTRDPPLQLSVVIDEAVLHREVGGPGVMGAQLEHLVEVAKLPNVMLQVIPYKAGAHPAMDSTFDILDFGEAASSLVYVEGLMGFLYIERPEDINRFRGIFEYLQSLALNPQDSIELMTKIRAQYNSATLLASGDSGK